MVGVLRNEGSVTDGQERTGRMGAAGYENPAGAAPEAQGPLRGHGDLRDGFRGQRHRGEAGGLDHHAAEGNKALRTHSALTMRTVSDGKLGCLSRSAPVQSAAAAIGWTCSWGSAPRRNRAKPSTPIV